MHVSDLSKWGIPERIIAVWRGRQGESLLPVQSRAVRKGLLGPPDNEHNLQPVRMVISAPTSSGKSFCAEMAMARALAARQKAVMLVPLKALAEQKFRLFEDTYGPLGVRCIIATGDHPENDHRLAAGDYQIAVVIYEKFDLLLTSALDCLKNIGLVVVDEIQTISEPGRGAILERLLTKIVASVYQPSLVCLSAVIGDDAKAAGRLADWLGATVVEETARPVELMRGIAVDGSFRYRSYNTGLDGREPFAEVSAGEEPFDGLIEQLKSETGSTLVFLRSRRLTVEAAFRLAAAVNWPEAKKAIERLSEEEPSYLVRSLRQALTRSVAFHNADLSPRQRLIIEEAFIGGEVRVIFSTTTLALGVDLPADTVYLETVKYSSGEYSNRPGLVPISRAEFDNMTGRAGRLRSGAQKVGRAVVLAETEFDSDVLWENYIAPDRAEEVRSAFQSVRLADWVLNSIVSGLAAGTPSLERLYARTFAAVSLKETPPDFAEALASLRNRQLLAWSASTSHFTPTAVGQAAARSGLTVAQTFHFQDSLQSIYPQTLSGWTALALTGPDWSLPPGMLSGAELADGMPVKMLHQQYDHLLEEASLLLGEQYRREPLSYAQAAQLKAFLLLHAWARLTPIMELEQQFQMHVGQIMSLGETAAHLILGLSVLLQAKDGRTPLREELTEHAFSLRFGMPSCLRQLHAVLAEALHRGDFLAFYQFGVRSLSDLRQLESQGLQRAGLSESKQTFIKEKLQSLDEENVMQPTIATNHAHPPVAARFSTQPESVEIDGTFERERYLVKINGFPVRLTGKSFKYFTRLAWWRLYRDNGWIYKEDLEIGFNQARYLYRMKGEVCSALGLTWPVFENNRLGYYRLNIDPSRIRIDVDKLRVHPDYEVRSLVSPSPVQAVN
ncbi:MAG TPA: DEAD/DEAH box helicase [Candidatus Deferrimicrobium sp.]|nr:DEAD/DEAH box helicase [Candidatus Deferrimicrobium sp.]